MPGRDVESTTAALFRHHKKIMGSAPYLTELKQSAINQRANVGRDAKGRKPVSIDGPIFR
jgi:hypothetical protein